MLPLLLPSVLPMCDSLMHKGNAVHILAEDMRYAKKVRMKGLDGHDYEVERGPVVYEAGSKNLVMDGMRKNALDALFFDTAPNVFRYGGVGSDGSLSTDASLDRLESENIDGTNRKLITDILNVTLHTSTFSTQVVQETSGSDRWKIVAQYVYDTTDALDTDTFAEYGIFDTQAVPGTPTGLSGILGLRYVPASSFVKQDGVKVTVQWTIRA
jgi:hypothetical protein